MIWYLKAFNEFNNFTGRASKQEYWMFYLFHMIFVLATGYFDHLSKNTFGYLDWGFLSLAYLIISFIPQLALTTRRLHDAGMSGWYNLLLLIPFIGIFWLMILAMMSSQDTDNKYAISPTKISQGKKSVITVGNCSRDTIIMIVISILAIYQTSSYLIPKLVPKYYSQGWYLPYVFIREFAIALIPLALACIIKDKSKQLLFFVIGGTVSLFLILNLVTQLWLAK